MGSDHHVLTEARGTPLCMSLTGGNRHDTTQLMPLLEAIQPVRLGRGRPRRRPRELCADRAYEHDIYRSTLRQHGNTRRPTEYRCSARPMARRLPASPNRGVGPGPALEGLEGSQSGSHAYARAPIAPTSPRPAQHSRHSQRAI